MTRAILPYAAVLAAVVRAAAGLALHGLLRPGRPATLTRVGKVAPR